MRASEARKQSKCDSNYILLRDIFNDIDSASKKGFFDTVWKIYSHLRIEDKGFVVTELKKLGYTVYISYYETSFFGFLYNRREVLNISWE